MIAVHVSKDVDSHSKIYLTRTCTDTEVTLRVNQIIS